MALPQATVSDVKEFVRLDDGIKEATAQMKEARKGREAARARIIQYMCASDIKRLGIKKGSQYLEVKEKTLKVRAGADLMKAKLAELVKQGITDPDVLYREIMACGGTKTVWKLCRRNVRKRKAPSSSSSSSEPTEDNS